jgi:hypothetical protein
MGDREDQMFRRWEERQWNNNNNNNNNDNYYSNNNNLPSVYPNNGSRTIFQVPANATNAVMFDDIEEDENMVNFHGEADLGRFYKRSTFNGLQENPISGFKKNPFTRSTIRPGNVRRLTARKPAVASQQGGRRGATHKRRVTHKRNTSKRRVTHKRNTSKRRGVSHKHSA